MPKRERRRARVRGLARLWRQIVLLDLLRGEGDALDV